MISSLRALRRLTIPTLLLVAVAGLARAADGEGGVAGTVLVGATENPAEGVTVSVVGARKESRVTGPDGSWEVTGLPAGTYTIRFDKPGFKPALINGFVVRPNESSRADLRLTELAVADPDLPPDVEEFVVVGTKAEAIEASRESSDQLLNTLSAEEFSKFAASDVADALRFVPGVNVVKGQFAVIRGLEDRYSSTLYNSAPVPSPDPDSQSVQLDLFPSEIVSNLVVAKTFAPDLPGNSGAGSINILTNEFPEDQVIKLSGALGYNSNAVDDFLRFVDGSPVGNPTDGWNTLESDYGLVVGGRREFEEREFSFKAILNRETDYYTAEGFQETREPQREQRQNDSDPNSPVIINGGLALGELALSAGQFDFTESERAQQDTAYLGFGFDLDSQGTQHIEASVFYSAKDEETVQQRDDGYLPTFPYETLPLIEADGNDVDRGSFRFYDTQGAWITAVRQGRFGDPTVGPVWFSSFTEARSFQRDRDLTVFQVNGQHPIEVFEGLELRWAANRAVTSQQESATGVRIFFEPEDLTQTPTHFPVSPEDLGRGFFAVTPAIIMSGNEVEEIQNFGRIDLDYEFQPLDWAILKFSAGGWFEGAEREVDASFLTNPLARSPCVAPHCVGVPTQFIVTGQTLDEAGKVIIPNLARDSSGIISGFRVATNDSEREVMAWSLGTKATVWDHFDVFGGVRAESISIQSFNNPYVPGQLAFDGSPDLFPRKYLLFDRLDNPARESVPPTTAGQKIFYNDQILGLSVPVDSPCPVAGNPDRMCVDLVDRADIDALINGEIDETNYLPAAGLTYRVPGMFEGLTLRAAYSQTVARPSFREMGYYVSVEPGSDDPIVGNPQLQLSDVDSYDLRGEYVWGEVGDLFAVSLFSKQIDRPIESIVLRDPSNPGSTLATFRTYFNNPDTASLGGIELEARKNLGFIPWDFAQHFSLGGNYTYIDAEVDRTEAELARSTAFFGVRPADSGRAQFAGLETSRRLFHQPEWIANADITFAHPDWGTRATLAYFAISSVLDAAGVANLGPDGRVESFTLDRYVDGFSRLDLIMSQEWGDWTVKLSAKNLTDSRRRILYDTDQTNVEIAERDFKLGREIKLSITYAFPF